MKTGGIPPSNMVTSFCRSLHMLSFLSFPPPLVSSLLLIIRKMPLPTLPQGFLRVKAEFKCYRGCNPDVTHVTRRSEREPGWSSPKRSMLLAPIWGKYQPAHRLPSTHFLTCRNFPSLLSLPAPGAETVDALTLHPDHSMEADYSSRSETTPCAKSV